MYKSRRKDTPYNGNPRVLCIFSLFDAINLWYVVKLAVVVSTTTCVPLFKQAYIQEMTLWPSAGHGVDHFDGVIIFSHRDLVQHVRDKLAVDCFV